MRAKVCWEARHTSGSFNFDVPGVDFKEWCMTVGDALTSSNGQAYLVGNLQAIPLRNIVRIEKLED